MPEPFVDPGGLLAHWTDTDLGPYVSAGGSCLKWITGRRGSGKTALLAALRRRAEGLGFRATLLEGSGKWVRVPVLVLDKVPPGPEEGEPPCAGSPPC